MARESSKTRVTQADYYNEVERMVDLVVDGSIVVVEAGDPGEDYYILRASGGSYELEKDIVSEGEVMAAGTMVVEGNWFVKEDNMLYRLDEGVKVFVCRNSIRHLLGDLEMVKKGRRILFKVSQGQHEDIVGSLLE